MEKNSWPFYDFPERKNGSHLIISVLVTETVTSGG